MFAKIFDLKNCRILNKNGIFAHKKRAAVLFEPRSREILAPSGNTIGAVQQRFVLYGAHRFAPQRHVTIRFKAIHSTSA